MNVIGRHNIQFLDVKHGVCKTKYLGTTVTKDNLIEEEIKERIAAGN